MFDIICLCPLKPTLSHDQLNAALSRVQLLNSLTVVSGGRLCL